MFLFYFFPFIKIHPSLLLACIPIITIRNNPMLWARSLSLTKLIYLNPSPWGMTDKHFTTEAHPPSKMFPLTPWSLLSWKVLNWWVVLREIRTQEGVWPWESSWRHRSPGFLLEALCENASSPWEMGLCSCSNDWVFQQVRHLDLEIVTGIFLITIFRYFFFTSWQLVIEFQSPWNRPSVGTWEC